MRRIQIKENNRIFTHLLIVVILVFSSCSSDSEDELIQEAEEEQEEVIPVPTEINSVISFDRPGQVINALFYDIKDVNKSITTAVTASTIFNVDDMNGIRTPILGNLKAPAHPSEGVVIASEYDSYVTSINFAKQARGTRDFKVFASKKLNDGDGINSFPTWVKDDNGIIPEKYAILLADFIEFMITQNIQIDYLGIDNEFVFNEGNITPQKYSETIDELRLLAADRGFAMPLLVGYEDFGPNKRNWIKTLYDNGDGDKVDIYGTHYYPKWRPLENLLVDLSFTVGRPFWSTEAHWDAKSEVDDLNEAEAAIVTLWDQIDAGMTGLTWWSYSLTGYRGNLMRAFSTPLLGAQVINITDIDGEDVTELGKLQTRAFREGNTITVYLVNNTEEIYTDYVFRLDGASIGSTVSAKQWNGTASENPNVSIVDPVGETSNIFSYNLDAKSITQLTFTIQ